MSVVGIDIAKRVVHLGGMDERGKIVRRKRCGRGAGLPGLAPLGPPTLGMAACGGAHEWARGGREPGHEVTRRAPPCVKPSSKSNKKARRDAEAIAAAVTRPRRRFVPGKDGAPQDSHALPRGRARLVTARPALVHERRGRGAADGMGLPPGRAQLRQALRSPLEAEHLSLTPLGPALCHTLFGAWGQCAAA